MMVELVADVMAVKLVDLKDWLVVMMVDLKVADLAARMAVKLAARMAVK